MPEISRGTRRIHFSVTPADSAHPPALLVPGLGGSSKLFGTLPRKFARNGIPCITFDPVGFGNSSSHTGPYDLDEAAADLLAVLDASGFATCDLMGTSLGGKVALCAADQAPDKVRRLVMLASAAVSTPRSKRVYGFFETLAAKLDGTELSELLVTFLFGATFHAKHADLVDDIVRSMKLTPEIRGVMVEQARCLHRFDGSDRASRIPCPALCLAGAEDSLTDAETVEATAALMVHGSYELVADAGHTLLLESAQVFERILDFLRSTSE